MVFSTDFWGAPLRIALPRGIFPAIMDGIGYRLQRFFPVAAVGATAMLGSAPSWASPVTFNVEVPYCTPPGATIYLRSNRDDPANFVHDSLTPVDATHYRGTVDVATPFDSFRYKYSVGICDASRCDGIEKDINFVGSVGEAADRILSDGATETDDLVFIWRDALVVFDAVGQVDRLRTNEEQVAFCGPYLSINSPQGAVGIGYDSYFGANVRLEWGLTTAYELGSRVDASGANRHHFSLGLLQPGATYHYRITEDGRPGADHIFRAPPGPGDAFRVGFLGDIQYYSEEDRVEQQQIIALTEQFQPDLLISPGDLVGSINRGAPCCDMPEMGRWNVLFGVSARLMAGAPFMVAMGNHEEDAPYFWDAFDFPVSDPPKLDHFAFTYGNTFFVFLYTGVTEGYDVDGILSSQTDWMESALMAANAEPDVAWKVIVLHRAPFSQGANHPSDAYPFLDGGTTERKSWRTIWVEQGVDLVLGGHNHNFTLARSDGIHYLMACAGAPIHELIAPWAATTIYAESTCSAVQLSIDASLLSVHVVRPDGSEVDAATLSLCQQAADCESLVSECTERTEWTCVDHACQADCLPSVSELVVAPSALSFVARLGSEPDPQAITVTGSDGSVSWSTSTDSSWLTVAPDSGQTPSTVTVLVAAGGLVPGHHSGNVIIAPWDGATVVVPVGLDLSPAPRKGCDCRSTVVAPAWWVLWVGLVWRQRRTLTSFRGSVPTR